MSKSRNSKRLRKRVLKYKNHSKERKGIVRDLDTVFSLYIRNKYGYRCVLCGATDKIQCGHLFSRTSYSTRWDEDNARPQCSSCNMSHEYDFYPFMNFFVKMFGQDKVDEIHSKYNKISHFSNSELKEMLESLKIKLEEVKK